MLIVDRETETEETERDTKTQTDFAWADTTSEAWFFIVHTEF